VGAAKTLFPPGDARLVKYQNDYVHLLLQMQRYPEAEAVAGDALKSLPSGETASRLQVLRSLADLYQQWKKPDEAERYHQAAQRCRRELWDRELAALSEQIQARPDDPAPLAGRARLHVRSGRFEQAKPDLDRLVQLHPTEHRHWFLRACLLAYLGDDTGYRRHCEAMLLQFADAGDAFVLDRTTKAALLLPAGAGGDAQMLARRAEKVHALDPDQHWFVALRGVADYRAGRSESAIQWLTNARAEDITARTIAVDAYLAMAHHRLGQPAEARAALDRCTQRIEKDLPVAGQVDLEENANWAEDWLIAHVARREAEQTVAK
jgi:predicted Zn-dependent protease